MSDPLIGKKLGDYTITSLLGRGGMARVYRGYDENLDRYAAVKVIETYLIVGEDRDEYYQRFQREARAIARLNHPNIVSVYQFGKIDENYYMAMSFINGQDLRQILKKHQQERTLISNALTLQIMQAMSSALDYAHKEGVIHRDIKPSNILVMDDGNAVLTDFGLALSVPEGTVGNTFGSAHYIAPEQAVSSAQAVPQSDLYSLGICLYEMLTGRVPFDDNSAMSVALKHLSDPPPPPSQLNPNIPPRVEEVIMKVLEKEPEDRYESGAALVQALERAFALSDDEDTHELASARPGGTSTSQPAPAFKSAAPTSELSTETVASISNREEIVNQTSARLKNLDANEKRTNRLVWAVGVAMLVIIGLLAVLLSVIGEPPATTPTAAAVLAITEEAASDTPIPTETTETEEAASDTPTPTETTETEEAASDTPTPTETTETEEAASDTPTPTETEEAASPTPTPIETEEAAVALPEGFAYVEARYDDQSLVLYNNSGETVDVSNLVFARAQAGGSEITFRSNNWRRNASQPPETFPNQDCFQVWTTSFSFLSPETYCNSRHSWRSVAPSRAFWLPSEGSTTFEVRRGDEVIATCELDAETCQIPVPER